MTTPPNETINAIAHNMVKNPDWMEGEQLLICKPDREVRLGPTEKQLELRGQTGTWTRDLRRSNYVEGLPLFMTNCTVKVNSE